jgi:hypothetical protein
VIEHDPFALKGTSVDGQEIDFHCSFIMDRWQKAQIEAFLKLFKRAF